MPRAFGASSTFRAGIPDACFVGFWRLAFGYFDRRLSYDHLTKGGTLESQLFQAVIICGRESVIVAEVIAENDDQAFEMVVGRLKHKGLTTILESWLKGGAVIATSKSELYQGKSRPGGFRSALKGITNVEA